MNRQLSILIYSCWKNRDMWEIFSKLFSKYWPNCPYPVILITDKYSNTGGGEDYVFDKIIQKDDSWAKMMNEAILQAKSPYVSLWMDDYLLCDYVQNRDIERYLEAAVRYRAANMRLIESPVCKNRWKNHTDIGFYQPGTAYSLSTQIGIWDSRFLLKIIDDKWSAWDFERIASLEKNNRKQPLLVALDYTFPYEEGVRKGKWMIQGVKLCKRNGIHLDTCARPIMSNWEMAKVYGKGAILDWNMTLIVRLQNLLSSWR